MSGAAGFTEPLQRDGTINERIRESWVTYMVRTLGRSEVFARRRAEEEVTRAKAAGVLAEMKRSGWQLEGAEILDVGSGHGALALELAAAGATVTALEPCESWRRLSEERAVEMGLSIRHLGADAHNLPFPDGAFDGCVSLQVLEHVRDPKRVIQEIARVLKPGGRVMVSCENYLSFWEPHYGVPWAPVLSKRLGCLYLRLLGRDPAFLRDHITYVYWPALAKSFIDAGLYDRDWAEVIADCRSGSPSKVPARRALYRCSKLFLGESRARTIMACAINRHGLFRRGFGVNGTKKEI